MTSFAPLETTQAAPMREETAMDEGGSMGSSRTLIACGGFACGGFGRGGFTWAAISGGGANRRNAWTSSASKCVGRITRMISAAAVGSRLHRPVNDELGHRVENFAGLGVGKHSNGTARL